MSLKKRILFILRKTTIEKRLLTLFLIQTLIILLWCGYMVKNSVWDFLDSLRFHNSQILSSVNYNMDQAVKELKMATKIPVIQSVEGDSRIFRYLSDIQTRLPVYSDYNSINSDLNNILSIYDDIQTVCVADLSGAIIYASDQKNLYYTGNILTDSEAFRTVLREKGGLLILNSDSVPLTGIYGSSNAVWGLRAIMNLSPYEAIGVLLCSIPEEQILEPFYTGKIYSAQKIGIFDKNGDQIMGDMSLGLNEGGKSYRGKNALIQQTVSSNGYITMIETPYGLIFSDISRQQTGLYLLLIFLFFSIIVITRLLVSSIQGPIHALKQACDALEQENFSIEITDLGKDEMHDLIESFHTMSQKIRYLIQEVYYKETLQAKTELQMLRSQINPHFMYNTLESIRAAAVSKENLHVAKMASLLGKTLRYGVSSPSEPVALRQELYNLKDYMELQNLRLEGRLAFNINIESCLEECIVIKLLLQPLVENAVYHGIGVTGQQGMIDVFGFLNGSVLTFKVTDNGVGISEDEVKRLNDYINYKNEHFKSIGLRNVNRRIKLYYGESYGLFIDSVLGRGTVITIEIPYIRKEEEEDL